MLLPGEPMVTSMIQSSRRPPAASQAPPGSHAGPSHASGRHTTKHFLKRVRRYRLPEGSEQAACSVVPDARVDRYTRGSRLSWTKELVKNTPRRSRGSDRTNPVAVDLRGPAGGQASARRGKQAPRQGVQRAEHLRDGGEEDLPEDLGLSGS